MALTALQIKGLVPRDKSYRIADEKGLYIEVFTRGSRLWRWKYRFAGKEKRLALGAWPDVSLAEARQLRDEARRKLREGVDPGFERKMEKLTASVNAGNTFADVAEEYIDVKLVKGDRANATLLKARWFLSQLSPVLGARPIADIQPAEVLAVVKAIEKDGKNETAKRVRRFASAVFCYGVATTRCTTDPAALFKSALAAPKVRHQSAILDPELLGAFLVDVDSYSGTPIVRLAMQILPHVFFRPGELRFAEWRDIDWDERQWTIPASRTKMRRQHKSPLSTQVITLLKELRQHSGHGSLMFPGHGRPGITISENSLNAAYRRLGYGQDVVCAHGFRATASTLLNESGLWLSDAIERALAHGESGLVRKSYARGEYWDERVRMAQWWSDFLDTTKGTAMLGTARARA